MTAPYAVHHHEAADRFEVVLEGHTAVLDYRRQGGSVVFHHTGVPTPLEGRGVGSALVKAGLAWARANDLKVVPRCSFVRGYVDRHPEYEDLLES